MDMRPFHIHQLFRQIHTLAYHQLRVRRVEQLHVLLLLDLEEPPGTPLYTRFLPAVSGIQPLVWCRIPNQDGIPAHLPKDFRVECGLL